MTTRIRTTTAAIAAEGVRMSRLKADSGSRQDERVARDGRDRLAHETASTRNLGSTKPSSTSTSRLVTMNAAAAISTSVCRTA